jgi:tetratricopeptide (TPR) repeat protein
MKKRLPLLKDSARVDAMNRISINFGYFARVGGFTQKTDSINRYASMAYDEAKKIGFKSGMAMALVQMSHIDVLQDLPVQEEATKEKNIREALRLAEEVNDNEVLGWGYYYLSSSPSIKKNAMEGEYLKKAANYFRKAGDTLREAEVTTWLCMLYNDKGAYEESFPYCDRCVQLAKSLPKTEWGHELVQWSLLNIAELYNAAGDYETALDYTKQCDQYAKANHLAWQMDIGLSEGYCLTGKYDSALYYWQRWKKNWNAYAKGHQAYGNTVLGQIYLGTKQYDNALEVFNGSIKTMRERKITSPGMATPLIRPLLFSGQAYAGIKNYKTALKYAREASSLAEKNDIRPYLIDSYELLSKVYHHLGKNDSAYRYLLQYTTLKDSILNRQFIWRLNNYKRAAEDAKKEARIGFLDRDNKIKEQQLKQESLLKWLFLAAMASLILIGISIFRTLHLKRKNEKLQRQHLENELTAQQKELAIQRLESEKKQTELQRQTIELEIQALRAQMNPHFIFNCLSSINRFILKNEGKTASDYLTRFSRLIRMVLINSQKAMISLDDELQMLRLYLDMERLRFKNSFDYNIITTNNIDTSALVIPPLLLQPFCENAIWHGLMHKEGQGQLSIALSIEDNILHCIITDNGVGREKAAELKSKSAEKEKSLGLKITTERLALLNQEKGVRTSYAIEDIMDEAVNISGTKVILKIRYKEAVEEYV